MQTVQVHTRYIDGYSEANRCLTNVQQIVQDRGGELVTGWLLHRGKYLIEKVHHCVWQQPSGDLFDITPQVSTGNVGDGFAVAELAPMSDFEIDPTAEWSDGFRPLPTRYVAVGKRCRAIAQALTISDEHFLSGNYRAYKAWTERAERLASRLGLKADCGLMNEDEFNQMRQLYPDMRDSEMVGAGEVSR